MNYVDLLFIIIFLWSAYKGFTKGFVIAIASLLALIIGIFGAIKFSGFTAGLLSGKFNVNFEYLDLVAFAITFILIVIAVHFFARLLDKLVEVRAGSLVWLEHSADNRAVVSSNLTRPT